MVLFNFDIAEFTRSLQSANGLRHGDYHRYRRFCSRKIHRIRSDLKLLNGRNRFKKAVMPEKINSSRYIELLVVYVERAWSHGLTLKSEYSVAEKGGKSRLRHAFIKKFRRAVYWVDQLVEMSRTHCDKRTILESEAYSAWIHGLSLTECGLFDRALQMIAVSEEKYTELIKTSLDSVFPNASRGYKHRIADLEPIERVCKYKLRLGAIAKPAEQEEEYESANEGGVGDFSSDGEYVDSDVDMSPTYLKRDGDKESSGGLLGKIGGWWNRSN
jgi:signal recognition particle subunit SRP68